MRLPADDDRVWDHVFGMALKSRAPRPGETKRLFLSVVLICAFLSGSSSIACECKT
jgi:hypothetical protein